MNDNPDEPLSASVEGCNLVIRIGVDRLAWCANTQKSGPLYIRRATVMKRRHREFASDVANALMRNDDVGNTLLIGVIYAAIKNAINNGSAALMWRRCNLLKHQPKTTKATS